MVIDFLAGTGSDAARRPQTGLSGWYFGPNDSPIHGGSREDTGDNQASPDEIGPGIAQPTADPTSFWVETSINQPSNDRFDVDSERRDTDGLEIIDSNEGRLELTNLDNPPAEDWAADSGPAKNPER